MKKWVWTLAVIGLLNSVNLVAADEKSAAHDDKEKATKTSESTSGERAKKDSAKTDDLSQKINACLNARPDEKSK